jgi:osmotically inducible protein OsmC
MPERRAEATWAGNLIQGHGTITSVGSGALSDLPVSWQARTESSGGKTSPEELLAAAQAACFAMAFSNNLAKAGSAPERLDVSAVCTFDQKPEGGWKVGTMRIDVRGHVPGIAAAEFERLAQETGQGCPISGAIRGNVEISVTAHLES